MERANDCLELILKTLRDCRGVKTLKVLTADEKKKILEVEEKAEERVAYGMCKTLNQGIKEALNRDYTVAIIMDTSIFKYPHHPYILMVYDDTIVGEQVKDLKRIEELKRDRANFFLWDTFVIYNQRLPKEREERQKLRIIYPPREALQLEGINCVIKGTFGTPSSEGDILLKKLFLFDSSNSMIGTGLIGFDIKK